MQVRDPVDQKDKGFFSLFARV